MSDRLAFLCKVLRGYHVEVTVRADSAPHRATTDPRARCKNNIITTSRTETDVAPTPDHPRSSPPAPSTKVSSAPMQPPTIR